MMHYELHYQLYGTYLAFRVEQIVRAQAQPITARECAEQLAKLPANQQYNLTRRVRKALELLVSNGQLVRDYSRRENFIVFTYCLAPKSAQDV